MEIELYYKFERELSRLLTPIEIEIINEMKIMYGEDKIIEALKESVYRGVTSLKYIKKILDNWSSYDSNSEEINADEWFN